MLVPQAALAVRAVVGRDHGVFFTFFGESPNPVCMLYLTTQQTDFFFIASECR